MYICNDKKIEEFISQREAAQAHLGGELIFWGRIWHQLGAYTLLNPMCVKDYLCYKTVTSQNVQSKAQIKNFFIL